MKNHTDDYVSTPPDTSKAEMARARCVSCDTTIGLCYHEKKETAEQRLLRHGWKRHSRGYTCLGCQATSLTALSS